MNEWQLIETAPFNKEVLLGYRNKYGNACVVKAIKHQAFKIEADDEYASDWCDYDEETDTYYLPEGWYECVENHPDYTFLDIPDELTIKGWWMSSPELPR